MVAQNCESCFLLLFFYPETHASGEVHSFTPFVGWATQKGALLQRCLGISVEFVSS